MKQRLLLQLYKPYLTVSQADEIREEIFKLKPSLNFVLPAWPWLEVRGVKEKDAGKVFEILNVRGVRFKVLVTGKKSSKAKVQVSETLEVC